MYTQKIAEQISASSQQVEATIQLLDEGATVPFIARYRKEATGNLTDTQLRQLVEQLSYYRELTDRKETILKTIKEQGKLTEALESTINACESKVKLEDLYAPYKPKRRTKAQIAREAGLEPLIDAILKEPENDPITSAKSFINTEKGIDTEEAALLGAREILAERAAEHADLLEILRNYLARHVIMQSEIIKGKEQEGEKYKDYFEYTEKLTNIPSHRALALFRGRKEGFLYLRLRLADDLEIEHCITQTEKAFSISHTKASQWLQDAFTWVWKIKLFTKLELDAMMSLRVHAEEGAIDVFNNNLSNLLMSAPAGNRVVMGLDPGFRTGVKLVVVDGTGKLQHFETIFPHQPQKKWDQALLTVAKACQKYKVELISIGNGTASRETDQLVDEFQKKYTDCNTTKLIVSEAGASVYSASELAAKEFPDLDVVYRGAVSIARRLQDPLAELVKIDPKAIGVGQYQHDVNQVKLGRGLVGVVEDCVNGVGADINTASPELLKRISGLSERIASNLVAYRDEFGRFKSRKALMKVPGFGEKTFQQAAGFLRIVSGENPLDASAVHPESYPLVDQIISQTGKSIKQLMGNDALIHSLNPSQFTSDEYGLPTVKDVLLELVKPGRDPRPEFKVAKFDDKVCKISDLKKGMKLEGVVSNVANFGAFVDIGVHQDGLVHVSQVSDTFIKNIHDVLKVGQIVKVEVVDVDVNRKRISLSMKENKPVAAKRPPKKPAEKPPQSDLAAKLQGALKRAK